MKMILVICVSSLRTAKVLETYQSDIKLQTWKVCLNNPQCYDQPLQGDWVCLRTKYKSIHPKGDSSGQLNSCPCSHKLILLYIHDTQHCSIHKVPNLQLWNHKALCNESTQCYCLSRVSRYDLCWSFWSLPKCQAAETISQVWVPIPIDSMITGMTAGREDRFKWTRNQGKAWHSAHCKSLSFTRLRSHCR